MQVIIWLALLVLFLIAEAATARLVAIWFALGSLAAVISVGLAPELLWLQIVCFVVVSFGAFAATRPLAKRHLGSSRKPIGAEGHADTTAAVTEETGSVEGSEDEPEAEPEQEETK